MEKRGRELSGMQGGAAGRRGGRFFGFRAFAAATLLIFLAGGTCAASEKSWKRVRSLLGKNDSAMVCEQGGSEIFAKAPDTPRIPASVLKVFTCLAARSALGPEFRFATDFFRAQKDGALVMKGYGDPLLISEVLNDIAQKIIDEKLDGGALVLDGSYFAPEISVPGAGGSANPYDSQPGALCANFNSIEFTYGRGGAIVSAEPQTPMTDFARNIIRKKKLPPGRVLLTGQGDESTLYAGHLLSALVAARGGKPFSSIRAGRAAQEDKLAFRFTSPYSLSQNMEKLLKYSNNFMTNQIFLAAGAKAGGPPATLAKSKELASDFGKTVLGLSHHTFVEGSGLSRQNKMTARDLDKVLDAFYPLRELLPEKNGLQVKTGTLSGISSRAGYIEAGGKVYRVSILCNTPGRNSQKVLDAVERALRTP